MILASHSQATGCPAHKLQREQYECAYNAAIKYLHWVKVKLGKQLYMYMSILRFKQTFKHPCARVVA